MIWRGNKGDGRKLERVTDLPVTGGDKNGAAAVLSLYLDRLGGVGLTWIESRDRTYLIAARGLNFPGRFEYFDLPWQQQLINRVWDN